MKAAVTTKPLNSSRTSLGVMPRVNLREAISLAKDTAEESGYELVVVTNTEYDEKEKEYTISLESGDVEITVTIDETNGEVIDFETE